MSTSIRSDLPRGPIARISHRTRGYTRAEERRIVRKRLEEYSRRVNVLRTRKSYAVGLAGRSRSIGRCWSICGSIRSSGPAFPLPAGDRSRSTTGLPSSSGGSSSSSGRLPSTLRPSSTTHPCRRARRSTWKRSRRSWRRRWRHSSAVLLGQVPGGLLVASSSSRSLLASSVRVGRHGDSAEQVGRFRAGCHDLLAGHQVGARWSRIGRCQRARRASRRPIGKAYGGNAIESQPAVRGLYGASLGRCSPHHGEVRSHAPMLAEWRAVSPSVQSDRAHSLVRGGCPLRASRQRQERSARLREPSMTSRECFCSQSPHRQQWCLGLP